MFCCSFRTNICRHKGDHNCAASTIGARQPNLSEFTCQQRHNAAKWSVVLCDVTCEFGWRLRKHIALLGVMLHVELSVTGITSLNLEFAMSSTFSTVAAMPELRSANATLFV